MKVTRVEKHIVKKSNKHYNIINKYCFAAKNLYNHANYIVRNTFVKERKWIRYGKLDKMLREDLKYPDYKNMPSAQSAQQTLRLLDKNWTSFFSSIKKWTKNKTDFLGRPKLPKYKDKSKGDILIFTNQQAKIKDDGLIHFPKTLEGFIVKPWKAEKLCQVRFLPRKNYIIVEVIYEIDISESKPDNGRYMGIDVGVDNLAAVVNNVGEKPLLINGKGLKSINQYYNKISAYYKSIAKMLNNRHYTNRLANLQQKRDDKINDYFHKASRFIINKALELDINTIVIGKNKNWKQESKIGKQNNQTFVQIPFAKFIQMIEYKAQEVGINVKLTEESYTSGTSFLDDEEPVKENYNKSRRIHRGLFISNKGIKINADVNGSYQILRKEFPDVYADGIEGLALLPVKICF